MRAFVAAVATCVTLVVGCLVALTTPNPYYLEGSPMPLDNPHIRAERG